jgi:hypothetical protein
MHTVCRVEIFVVVGGFFGSLLLLGRGIGGFVRHQLVQVIRPTTPSHST